MTDWMVAKVPSSFPVFAHIPFSLISTQRLGVILSQHPPMARELKVGVKTIPMAYKSVHDLTPYHHLPAFPVTSLTSLHAAPTPGCSAPSIAYYIPSVSADFFPDAHMAHSLTFFRFFP